MLTLIPLCLPYDCVAQRLDRSNANIDSTMPVYDCVAQRLDRSNANIDSTMPALRLCGPAIGLF